MKKFLLENVQYIPKVLEPNTLYVSKEFEIAAHLCPCGCGHTIITPLNPAAWSIKVERGLATLYPSIGNWQLPCRSHYWIRKGLIEWSYQWTDKEIKEGRMYERKRRELYFASLKKSRKNYWYRFKKWFID